VTAKGTSTEALAISIDGLCLVIADINGRPDDAKLLQTFALPTILLRLGGEEERLKEAKERSGATLLFKPVRMQEFRRALLRVLAPVDSLVIAPSPRQPTEPSLSSVSLRILLAEDNVTNQLIVTRLLARLGQKNVTIVSDGRQAVDICRTTRFDLIFMDIMMPELNGWDATRQIRALGGTPVYIVALSANAFAPERQMCSDVGMDSVVTKPIQSAELTRAITEAQKLRQTLHNSSTAGHL